MSHALGILVAWPLLAVVPGWLLVRRALPDLPAVGQVGSGIVLSLFLSTHLVELLGRAVGDVDLPVLVTAVALLGVTSIVVASVPIAGLGPPPLALRLLGGLRRPPPLPTAWEGGLGHRRAATGDAWRAQLPAWALASAAGVGVAVVYRLSWHHTSAGWVAGGWNWSDLLLHAAHATSLQQGNFPPQVPYAAGAPLLYHWFGDFQAAIAATLADIDVIDAMAVGNGICTAALALVLWQLTASLTGSRRAATLATIIGIAGGGLATIRLGMDLRAGGRLVDLVGRRAYDGPWFTDFPQFRIASVLGTGLLAQRATAYGLAGVVTAVLLLHSSLGRNRAGVLCAGLTAGLLAPFHLFFFPATYLIAALIVVSRRIWRARGWPVDVGLFLLPALYGLAFALEPALRQANRGSVRFVLGWPDSPLESGPLGLAFFYATNLGVPFLLAVVALARRSTPQRLLLGGWIVGLFAVANLVVPSALTEDSGKWFQLAWMPIAILAAWAIRAWSRPTLAVVLALSCASPLLTATWYVRSQTVALSDAQMAAAEWIADHTPRRSVFVTDPFVNSPVDLAGRLRVTTFGAYVANLGFDPAVRDAEVRSVYCGGADVAAAVMRRVGASYVLSSSGLVDCSPGEGTDFSRSPAFETVYQRDGVTIWQLRG